MVPPTLLEIIKHISERELNSFEGNRRYHQKLKIPENECLGKPPKEVSKRKEIETSIDNILKRI